MEGRVATVLTPETFRQLLGRVLGESLNFLGGEDLAPYQRAGLTLVQRAAVSSKNFA